MAKSIAGVLPVVHLPLDDREEIDFEVVRRQVEWALMCGAQGCCTGMVTEILRLSGDERQALHARLVEFNAGRGVVVASVGAESRRQAVAWARHAEQCGCDALMAIPPTTVALPAAALRDYFLAICDAVALPLIVQDASAYVGQSIPLDVLVGLLDRFGPEKVFFKPEAAPIGPHLSALRDATGGRARIFDGSGGILLVDCFRRGIVGTIPGMEVLDGIVALWRALQADDTAAIYRVYYPICALVALQLQAGLDGFLAIEKYILQRRGLFINQRRRTPVAWELDRETAAEVDRQLAQLQAALGTDYKTVAC
jgi:2-keto-3-deoxy-L-arabinonate dehydratase